MLRPNLGLYVSDYFVASTLKAKARAQARRMLSNSYHVYKVLRCPEACAIHRVASYCTRVERLTFRIPECAAPSHGPSSCD